MTLLELLQRQRASEVKPPQEPRDDLDALTRAASAAPDVRVRIRWREDEDS